MGLGRSPEVPDHVIRSSAKREEDLLYHGEINSPLVPGLSRFWAIQFR